MSDLFCFIRKIRAKVRGVPFEYFAFWPPYYINFGGFIRDGIKVSTALYDAKVGDIVPVLTSDWEVHHYRLLGTSVLSGDDHIVSPRQFHIRYHHTDELELKP